VIIKKLYIMLLMATCLLGCKPESEEIKADLSGAFVGTYSGILAHNIHASHRKAGKLRFLA
jgi:hypothetical protein